MIRYGLSLFLSLYDVGFYQYSSILAFPHLLIYNPDPPLLSTESLGAASPGPYPTRTGQGAAIILLQVSGAMRYRGMTTYLLHPIGNSSVTNLCY